MSCHHEHCSNPPPPHPPIRFKGGGTDLTKNSNKGWMEKSLKGRGDSVGKGDAVSLHIFSSWGVANLTTVPILITSWS